MYYAVECQDYVYSAGGDRCRPAKAFLADAETLGVTPSRLPSVYYGDMPCLYWPNRPTRTRAPPPIVDPPYPTWIMVATTDPITPPANAMRLAGRLRDVHVIVQTGGPHVIFGWGLSCPDDVVADYLVKGKEPAGTITVCKGSVVDPYVPLARDTEAAYPDALSPDALARHPGAEHQRLRRAARRGPDRDGLRLRRRPRLHADGQGRGPRVQGLRAHRRHGRSPGRAPSTTTAATSRWT